MYEQAWDIIVELNDRHHMNTMRWSLAEARLHLGEYGQALIWGQQALDHAKKIGLRSHEGDALLRLGMLKLADGAYEEARVMVEESAVIYRQIVQPVKLGDLLGPLCLAYLGLGDLKQVRKFLVELLQIGTEQGNVLARQNAIPIAAMYLVEIDNTEQAVEIYALASREPYKANSHRLADVVGRHIAIAAAALPTEVIEVAQARGRARDLDSTARALLSGLRANIILKRASTLGLMTVFD
jgi:tetratricopeptide (TPR) repeat protein